MTKEYLIKKMRHHEDKAHFYYDAIRVMEDKARLIGFKPKNDNRMSSDLPQLIDCKLPVKEDSWY